MNDRGEMPYVGLTPQQELLIQEQRERCAAALEAQLKDEPYLPEGYWDSLLADMSFGIETEEC